MVPDESDEDETAGATTDGGAATGVDERVLYAVVRSAVEDAILGAIGTILLTGVGLVLAWAGVAVVLSSDAVTSATLGVALALVGGYVAAATLELVPPIREWGK